jgi:hypothetical protein
MDRWPKRVPYVVLICALAFGVMPGASFGQDGAVGDLDPKANAGHRFASERLFSAPAQRGDDWEPSVAADGSGHVYIATTRFDGPNACRKCPDPAIVYERSSDGGRTWSGPRFLCPCRGVEEQADPVLVTDERGRLFATWMNDFVVQFSRSDDFGRTWTQPRSVDGRLRWSDKPWIGVSDGGKDIYIAFNGPGRTEGTPYTVYSHDAGASWSRPVGGVRTNGLYWFAGGLTVTPKGTAISSQDAYEQDYRGNVLLYVLRSEDGGRSWTSVPIAKSRQGRRCPKWAGCGLGFLGPQMAISTDEGGRVYVLWNQTSYDGGPAQVYLRRSADDGATWSPARKISSANEGGVDSEFPMITAAGPGDVRVAWMDNRSWLWNTWYRRSTDGGRTWSGTARLSDRPDGAPYKSRGGFGFPYGDYGQLAVDGRGRTHAAWGEGPSYAGPGGTWYTRGPLP